MTEHANGVLRSLRALAPSRPLTFSESLHVAELQAARLRCLLGIDEARFPEEAFDAFPRLRIVRRFGLPVSGLTYWEHGRWVIAINASEAPGRQRFSLAHEFKHIIDHGSRQHASAMTTVASQRAERIADYFAGCLMAPKRYLKALFCRGASVEQLSSTFDLTPRAIAFRLYQVGLVDPVARCQRGARPGAWEVAA